MENAFKNKALYHQLVDLLQERIETCMIPHDKLPSERELTAQSSSWQRNICFRYKKRGR